MAQGLSMLAANEVDAYVTTGSTAALVIKSRKQLSLIEGVDKPGLLATLPSQAGPISLIDAGAIVRVGIPSIIQFAKLASIYQHLCFGKRKVKVGLLNIGRERSKGTGEVQQAFSELESYQSDNLTCNFDFIGNIEAREVFEGNVDVVVTDGFTGNVFLKSTEGTSAFILNYLSQILPQDVLQQANLRQAFHYQEYPGALLCGVNKLVIKSHGYSTAQGFFESIKEAANLAESALVAKLKATYEA
jgi:glycerol-3-phosphate acyltransferase PlsX